MPPTPEDIAIFRRNRRQRKREELWQRWKLTVTVVAFLATLGVGVAIGRFLLP